jgi:hypothetical protein
MKIEIEITGCKDCPMCHYYREQGYSSYECVHPKSTKKGYEAAINNNKDTPDWCPVKD